MFKIEYVKNLMWNDPEHTSFSCVVKYAEFNEEHPAGINPNDRYSHIQEIWQNGIAGVYGPIKEYEPAPNESVIIVNEKMPVTVFGETQQA